MTARAKEIKEDLFKRNFAELAKVLSSDGVLPSVTLLSEKKNVLPPAGTEEASLFFNIKTYVEKNYQISDFWQKTPWTYVDVYVVYDNRSYFGTGFVRRNYKVKWNKEADMDAALAKAIETATFSIISFLRRQNAITC